MIVFLLITLYVDDFELFQTDDARDLEMIVRDLEYLKYRPVDLNTAGLEELITIPYLTLSDCLRIIRYRSEHGPYRSVDDLRNIAGMEKTFVEYIRPFVTAGRKALDFKKFTTRIRTATDVPPEDAAREYYTRSEAFLGDYRVYFLTQKDPLEDDFFDYYAGGILYTEGARRFILGKYNLDFGSGVMLSPLGSFLQTVDFRVLTKERGIVPYTSVNENSGFFGAALSDTAVIGYTVFYSNQDLDGTLDTAGYATSFYPSGDHIDSLTSAKKDRINEEIVGYNAAYRQAQWEIANRTFWCTYTPGFVCDDSSTDFYGTGFWMTGVSIKYYDELMVLFAECARSHQNRIGGVFGLSGYYSILDINLAGKYFPAGYYSPKGVEARDDYVGGQLAVDGHLPIADVGVLFSLDDATAEVPARYGVQATVNKTVGIVSAKLQLRWRFTEIENQRSGSRIFIRVKPFRVFFFDIRLEDKYVYEDDVVERGLFGALECGLDFKCCDLRARLGHFDTDSYASRIYAYEIDLPGVINNRMLYFSGDYGFLYLSVRPFKGIKLSAKYSLIDRDENMTKHVGVQLDITL